jgi:hypothetical protein
MPGPQPPAALAALKPATVVAIRTAAKRYFMLSPFTSGRTARHRKIL